MADDDLTDRILREIQTGLVDLRQQNGVIIRMLQRIVDAQRPRFGEARAGVGARQGGWMMTAAELKARLKRLKLRQVQLAEKMQLHPVTVRRWATGIRPVPSRVDAWLDAYERELEQKEWLELYERQLGRRVPTPV